MFLTGIKLYKGNYYVIAKQIQHLLENGQSYRLTIKPWRNTRSLSQNALSHMWYAEISDFLIRRGKAFASPEWVKDAMKHAYLGYENRGAVDVITGAKTTICTLRHTSGLDTGEMHDFMRKVEGCALNIGCHLTIPQDSEFMQLRTRQEA